MRHFTHVVMQIQYRGRDAWIRERQFQLVGRMQRSWRREMADACMYRALASRERIADRQRVFLALASATDRRAARWAARLRRSGIPLPSNDPRLWETLRCWWAVRLGSIHILHLIERRYAADETWYVQYYLMMTHTALREVPTEKRSHTIGA